MAGITREEQQVKKQLLGKCYNYLNDNFHKFKEASKIKIAVDLIKRDMPTSLEHSGEITYTKMGDIVVEREGHNRVLEFDIGEIEKTT